MIKKSLSYIAILTIMVLLASCKKEAGSGLNSKPMRFSFNNSAVSYATCFYSEAFDQGYFEASIFATNTTDLTSYSSFPVNVKIQLILDTAGLKIGKTYPLATGSGQPGTSSIYYSPDGISIFATDYENDEGSVTITGITASTLSGTFSCKIFPANGDQTKVYTISNGSFTAAN